MRHDRLAGGLREPGAERRGLAEVAAQPDDLHVLVGRVQPGERGEGAVRRAVVDIDGFPRLAERIEGRLELLEEERDAPLLVVDRHDDRDHGG